MIELKSNLEGEKQILDNHLYMIDFSKLTSVNDLIFILASMGIGFPSNHPNIEQLKPFLNIDNPISLTQQPTQQAKKVDIDFDSILKKVD